MTASSSIHAGPCLGDVVLRMLDRHQERCAIVDGAAELTFRQLQDRVLRLAARLALNLPAGAGIAMLSPNRWEVIAVMLASQVAGLRYTPLHPLGSESDHAFILRDADVSALIFDPAAFSERAAGLEASDPELKLFSIGPSKLAPDIMVALDEACPWSGRARSSPLAYLAYTGGTTGRPKGVMLSHRAIISSIAASLSEWDWPQTIRFQTPAPVSHSAGVLVYPVLLSGGAFILERGFQPAPFMAALKSRRATCTFLVPSLIYALLDLPPEEARAPDLQMMVYGASPITPARLSDAIGRFGPIMNQLYGQTEAPNMIASLRAREHERDDLLRLSSCGRPGLLNEVRRLRSDLTDAEPEEPAEICVRGPLVMDGYWGRKDETEEALAGGWLHTGDVAVEDPGGFLRIVDRSKNVIVTGGFNVYPREVEEALISHPAILEAAVVARPDPKWGEAVHAFVSLRPGHSVTDADLVAHVRARKGSVHAPKAIERLDRIPLTALGKIDHATLRSSLWAGMDRQIA